MNDIMSQIARALASRKGQPMNPVANALMPSRPTPQMPQDMPAAPMMREQYLRSDGADAWSEFENMQQTGDLMPPQYPWREGKLDGSSFNDAAAYQVADMSGIEPAGVGEQAVLQKQARAFQSLMAGLDDYEQLFADVGQSGMGRVLPGSKNDALSTAHRNLQMQMKELYNLGVLNGPDLDLMNEILLDPTDISSNLLGAVGLGNMNERIPANIKRVREMMRQLAEPGLQQLGIEPERLMPQQKRSLGEMSDEEIKQMLLGGS